MKSKRFRILFVYSVIALLVITYTVTKNDKKDYKYTYMNPSTYTMGKSNDCYSSNYYHYCEVNGKHIIVEEYWY